MSRNNYFEIKPLEEPKKYEIFKELQMNQAVIIEDVSKKEYWQPISIQIGMERNNVLLDGEKVVMAPATNRRQNVGFIVRKPNITFDEIKKGDISRFYPKRIDGK